MPPHSGKSVTRGGWRAIALSVLLHSAIIGGAVYGWFTWKHRPPPVETLAIEATVVDERALKGLEQKPAPPEPAPVIETPPPEEQGPPKPDTAELERKEAERLEKEKTEQERLANEKAEQQKRDEKAAQESKTRDEAQKLEAEKQAAAKAAARKAEEKAAAEKAAADKKALEKKRADDAAAEKKAADEKARAAREAELRRSLEAEEHGNAIRNSDEAARWQAQIIAKIQSKWIKPPSAQPGIECKVSVTQVPGGDVTAVHVTSCSVADAALRESVEAAVLRASPLPSPPDQALFERNLELTFAPK